MRTTAIIRIIIRITMMVMMMMSPIWVIITSCISPIWSIEWVVPWIIETIKIWVVIPYRPTISTIIPSIPTAIQTTIPIITRRIIWSIIVRIVPISTTPIHIRIIIVLRNLNIITINIHNILTISQYKHISRVIRISNMR